MALKSMYPGQAYSPQTTLAASCGATDTSITLSDASVLPAPPNYVVIGSYGDADCETILYETRNGNVLTGLTRGVEGNACAHDAGDIAACYITAAGINVMQDNIRTLDEKKEERFSDAKDKTVSFSEAASRENIETGETFGAICGKIAKWFSSFGSAAWKGVGTGAGDVAAGNHTHGNVSNDGKLGSDAGKLAATGADGVLQAKSPNEVSVAFSAADEKSNIASGDTLGTILGKIAKWFSSFGSAAWKGVGTGADDVAAGNHTHSNYLTSETDPSVPSWAKEATKPSYSASEVGADPTGTASGAVSSHNSAADAHSGVLEKAFTDAKDKTVSFSAASSRENIATGETFGVICGKIAKWFSSFGGAAWKGVGTGADDVAAGDHTHDGYIPTSEKGAASGVATLNSDGKVTADQASAKVSSVVDVSFSISPTVGGIFTVCKNENAITIVLPTMTEGTELEYYRAGAGAVTFEPGTGVTFECKASNYGIADQYTSVVVKWRTDSIVVLEGNVG